MDPELTLEAIRAMPDDKLRDYADAISEGLADMPPHVQEAYRLMREEMARRARGHPESQKYRITGSPGNTHSREIRSPHP